MSHNGRAWISERPIAHRGLHDAVKPENSLGAFEAAAAKGYGIELDIHCSRDDQLVVFHDDNTSRLTGRDLLVTEATFDELSALRLGDTEYRIPSLREALELVRGRVPLLIEVKTGSPMARVGPLLAKELADYSGEVAVQSFDPRVLTWLKRNMPRIPRGQICGSLSTADLSPVHRILLRTMVLNATNRPDFIAFEVGAMPDVFVSLWRRLLRVPLLLWTVRTEEQFAAAARHRANPIFENVMPSS